MRLIAVLIALALSVSCTFVSQPRATKVYITAQGPTSGGVAALHRSLAARGMGHQETGRPTGSWGRNLSAANDVDVINYTVYDLGNGGIEIDSGTVDLSWLSLALELPGGGEFRVKVDVILKANAKGTNVGVMEYGDQADFTVDSYYDTYVNLTVHPTKSLVFDPASVVPGAPATIGALNPSGTPVREPRAFFDGTITVNPADKIFYSPEADLFYFNKNANAVYRWPKIVEADGTTEVPIESTDAVIDGAGSFDELYGEDPLDTTVTIYAACADPEYLDTLWVVGQDMTDMQWYYYGVDLTVGNSAVYRFPAITDDLEAELSGTITPMVTGIAVDQKYHDVYITYYSTDGTDTASGVLQYYQSELYARFPDPALFDTGTSSISSIYTDVAWEQNKAWVSVSPNTAIAGLPANTGKANILLFDDELNSLFFDAQSVSYEDDLPTINTSLTQLALPNRFLGPIQASTLYLSQQDFLGGAPAVISAIDIDNIDVVSY